MFKILNGKVVCLIVYKTIDLYIVDLLKSESTNHLIERYLISKNQIFIAPYYSFTHKNLMYLTLISS